MLCGARGAAQINNGVYRSGFATTQGAYAAAQQDLYGALDAVERRLSQHRFLIGDRCTALPPLMSCYAHGPAPRHNLPWTHARQHRALSARVTASREL